MKPPNWVSSVNKIFRFLLCCLVVVSCQANADSTQVARIKTAQYIISDSATLPPPDAKWQPITLPHHAPKPTERELIGYWYKASFDVADAKQDEWVLFQQLVSGGEVYVNGALIGETPSANEKIQVRWYLPELWLIPPSALHPGSNEIEVRFAIREPFTSFGEIDIGPEKLQRATYDQLLFWEDTSADISTALCLIAGSIIIIVWIRRPKEKLYGLFGLCVLFWGIRTYLLREPIVSTDILLYWRCGYYFATAGFIVLISTFLLSFSETSKPIFTKILIAYWFAGTAAFLIFGFQARHFIETYWLTGLIPFNLYAVAHVLNYAARQRTHNALAMGLAIVFALGLSLHDLAVQEAWVSWPEIYLMHLGIPAFLLVMIGILLDRFLDSLALVENVNEQLERRVNLREQELKYTYEQVRKLERVNAATEERQRIMQDMHDGVGSQLFSTLLMAQSAQLSQPALVGMLQECLDDMRLVIDSLSPDESDLLPVLGNFRFRMEARFRAIGLNLEWHHRNIPDALNMEPNVGLQVLRILQEALTNILKHAQAKNVVVELVSTPTSLRIRVADDGVGFEIKPQSNGRGVGNMRTRAQKIGAELTISSLTPGTEVSLSIAL